MDDDVVIVHALFREIGEALGQLFVTGNDPGSEHLMELGDGVGPAQEDGVDVSIRIFLATE